MPEVLPAEQGPVVQVRPPIRIDVQDADEAIANIASALLRKAWQPPCLHYTPEFVRFQTSYPSSLTSTAVLAWSGDEPVAFVVAMGRDSTFGPIYVSSFYCALPGCGVAAPGIVRKEVSILKRAALPSLVFAASGSIGEAVVWKSEVAGRPQRQIGTYHVHMAAPRAMPAGFETCDLEPQRWGEYAERFRPRDPGLLSPVFTPAVLRHMAGDPQGRRFLAASAGGEVLGVAVLSHTHNLIAGGALQILPTLSYLRFRDMRPDVLSALVSSAGGPLVTIPNTTGIMPEMLRAARVRATPASFVAVIAGAPDSITKTDFEII